VISTDKGLETRHSAATASSRQCDGPSAAARIHSRLAHKPDQVPGRFCVGIHIGDYGTCKPDAPEEGFSGFTPTYGSRSQGTSRSL